MIEFPCNFIENKTQSFKVFKMPSGDEIREALRNLRPPPTHNSSTQLVNIPRFYREEFKKFYQHFSTCPVCKIRNHENYLVDFYFSDDLEKIKIKQQMLDLLRQLENFKENIILGIPCCSCFERLFNTKNNEAGINGDPVSVRSQLMAELREILSDRRID